MAWHPWVRSDTYPNIWTAVYRLYDADRRLLYVGMAYDYVLRFRQHARKHWWPKVASKDVIWFDNRLDAAYEEARAIREEAPVHNERPGISRIGVIVFRLRERRGGRWVNVTKPKMSVNLTEKIEAMRWVRDNQAHAALVYDGEMSGIYVPWDWYERAKAVVDAPTPEVFDIGDQSIEDLVR